MPTPAEIREDKAWLKSQDIDLRNLPRHATWYKADGTALHGRTSSMMPLF